jgi:hypothetical protein
MSPCADDPNRTLVVKRLGREADHSPPPSADVENAWCLVKHRDEFTFNTNEMSTCPNTQSVTSGMCEVLVSDALARPN